jgi:hypothetical protein
MEGRPVTTPSESRTGSPVIMRVLLKNGPFHGQTVTVPDIDVHYRPRAAGEGLVYEDTAELDPMTGLRVFTLRSSQPLPAETLPRPTDQTR